MQLCNEFFRRLFLYVSYFAPGGYVRFVVMQFMHIMQRYAGEAGISRRNPHPGSAAERPRRRDGRCRPVMNTCNLSKFLAFRQESRIFFGRASAG
jgi:hypothetical protein